MPVILDHMSVHTHDKAATADFYARVFDVPPTAGRGQLIRLRLSPALELHFEEAEAYKTNH